MAPRIRISGMDDGKIMLGEVERINNCGEMTTVEIKGARFIFPDRYAYHPLMRTGMGKTSLIKALKERKLVRKLEWTVDWANGEEVQTVLRTCDERKARTLFNRLIPKAAALNKLGVEVCVEMTCESKEVRQ